MNIRTVVVAVSVFLVALAGSAVFAETAHAAPSLSVQPAVINDMRPTITGMALAECLANDTNFQDSSYLLGYDRISTSNAGSGQWFVSPLINGKQNDAHLSYLYSGTGFTHCSDSTFITNAVKIVGFDSNIGALCGLDFGRVNGSDCVKGTGDFKQLHHLSFDTYYGMIKTLNQAGVLTDAQRYLFYMRSMELSCSAQTSDSPGDPAYTWTADVVDSTGTVTTGVNYIGTAQASDKRDIAGSPNTKGIRCDDMAKSVKQYAQAYALYVKAQQGKPVPPPAGDIPTDQGNATSTSGTKTTCAIASIGWIVCPVVSFMATMADGTKGVLDGMLEIKATSLFDTGGSAGSLYGYWQQMRNIANILFVIGFLVIIYSQITGAGVSNYGLKKLLPKLIVVAVLVNVSFWLCAVAVDLSNLLGYSIDGLLGGALQQNAISDPSGYLTGATPFTSLVGKILAGGIVFAAGAAALYFFLGAVVTGLIGMLFAAITAVVVIGVRAALITLLIVVSPLAMAALLLPNTENLTKKWLDLFKGLLLVFPIISLLYGGGKLASKVLQAPSGDFGILINFIGAILPFIMLFAGYTVLKKALDGINGAGAFIGGIGKLRGMAEGKGKSAADNSTLGQFKKYRDTEANRRRAQIQAGVYNGSNKNPANWGRNLGSKFHKGITNPLTGGFGSRRASQGITLANKISDEELADQVNFLENGYAKNPTTKLVDAEKDLKDSIEGGNEIKARAAFKILTNSGGAGLAKARSAIIAAQGTSTVASMKGPQQGIMNSLKVDANSAGLKGKDNALATWAYVDDTVESLAKQADTYNKLNDEELAGQSAANIKTALGNNLLDKKRVDTLRASAAWVKMSKENRDLIEAKFPTPSPASTTTPPAPMTTP